MDRLTLRLEDKNPKCYGKKTWVDLKSIFLGSVEKVYLRNFDLIKFFSDQW